MAITAVSRIVEERRLPTPPPDGSLNASQPRIFPAPDFPFKGWQQARTEGYGQSAANPGENAIVIDAGTERVPSREKDEANT